MKRLIEFDLVTKIEANSRFASKAGMFAKAKRTKEQRAATGLVLHRELGAPPPAYVVQVGNCFTTLGAVGLTVRNRIAVTFTRIAPGQTADAWENLPGAFKGIKDEVAAWLGVDDAERAGILWQPPQQEKAAPGVYRVRIEIVDLLTGEDRIVRLAETRSAGVQAAARVKRAITKAKKPTANDLRDAAERLLSPPRDPGEEKSARDLANCTTCRARLHVGCDLKVPGRITFGVHVARARDAGLHVPEDDRAKVRPARAPRGARKLVPAARPAGQAVLPMLKAYAACPWDQSRCEACDGLGWERRFVVTTTQCPPCGECSDGKSRGTGRARGKGLVLVRAARYDGLDEPPPSILASVPPEHASRYGSAVTLHRHKFTSAATGPCWLFDERTETT